MPRKTSIAPAQLPLYLALGDRIADARQRLDAPLTQGALGRRIGVCRVTVWNWENGVVRPAIADVYALARALGRPVAELLPAEDEIDAEATA